MIVLSCKNLTKDFGIDSILKDITFNINEGEKVGFVGHNGAGKSTLFKILTNQLSHDSGEFFYDKSKTIGYLSQNLSLESQNTIHDEMLSVFSNLLKMEDTLKELEVKMNEPYDESNSEYHYALIDKYTKLQEKYDRDGGYTYKTEITKVLCGLGFAKEDFDKSIDLLSGGQKTRLALCKLLLTTPEILLLDEPTNHLDLDAIEWLENYLCDYNGTVVIISHDRFFLDKITNTTMELLHGKVKVYNGNYTSFIDLKKKNYEVELKAFEKQQAEIKKQEDVIKTLKSFNREKSVKRARSREKALDKVEKIDAPMLENKIKPLKFDPAVRSGNDVLSVSNLAKSFGEKHLFEELNLEIKLNDKAALVGENGRGKTTLFNIIMSKINPDNGVARLGRNVNIGYYDQEQSNLDSNKTILDEVWDSFPNMTNTEIRSALASFLFYGDDVYKLISTLSGGEKCRINLLKLMLSNSNFLLLDEPTNHLDIMSREALEDALISYTGTLLIISHDRYFLNKVIDKIYELNADGVKEYLGNYSYYVDKKKNPTRFDTLIEEEGKTKTQIKAEKKKIRDQEKAKKQKAKDLKQLERDIASLEEKIEEQEALLCKEEIYSDIDKSLEVNTLLSDYKAQLDELYISWENFLEEDE